MATPLDSLRQVRNALRERRNAARESRAADGTANDAIRAIEAGWFLSRAGQLPPSRTLAIGPGSALLGQYLSGSGHSVICVDAGELPRPPGFTRMSCIKGDIATMEFPGAFDLVTAPSLSVREIHSLQRLLAPDSRMLFSILLGEDANERLSELIGNLTVRAEAYWRTTEGKAWEQCPKDLAIEAGAVESARALGLFELSTPPLARAMEPILTDLALVTSCKPFKGRDGENQNIALASWRRAGIEVVIAGDEANGAAETKDMKVIAQVRRARDLQSAAPYLRSIVEAGLEHSSSSWMCLSNADIVIPPDFKQCVSRLVECHGSDAIFTVRRRDLRAEMPDLLSHIPLPSTQWTLHSPLGTDLFVASREMWQKILDVMPDFVFGRVTWDNWMHCCMIRLGKPVDASWTLETYHLPHGYEIQDAESLSETTHTETPGDKHNRALFQSSPMRIGELGDVRVDGPWLIGAS
jgi:hypothetical protein